MSSISLEKNLDIQAIEAAVKNLCNGDLDFARKNILKIDEQKIVELREKKRKFVAEKRKLISEMALRVPRQSPTNKIKIECFKADRYICCYCARFTVHSGIFKLIHKMIPETFLYNANWSMSDCNMAVWAYSADYEHLVPLNYGGKDEPANVRTACADCNGLKNSVPLKYLEWEVIPRGVIQAQTDWDGLESFVSRLRDA